MSIIDKYCDNKSGKIVDGYECTLNQTDIKTNKNKFYIMQLIEDSGKYVIFIRYGRVGEKGRISHTNYGSPESAKSWFEKQFKSKTKNNWNDRQNFKAFKGKYFMCEIDYGKDVKKAMDKEKKKSAKKVDSQLDERVQDFIRLISDVKEMNNTLVELEIDTEKMPLGKISDNQIQKGYEILNKIKMILKSTKLSQADLDNVMDLSSEFHTIIPYACSRGSRPPVIDDDKKIQKFTETLDELGNLEVAAKIIENSDDQDTLNQLDAVYKQLNTDIKALEKDSKMWNVIHDYVKNTHAPTHNSYTVEMLDVYEIQRHGERDTYHDKYGKDLDNKWLLWHGTRVTNFCSILQKGLLLRPDVIPGTYISGKMFGYGIYAASSFSKSFNYTGASGRNSVACLFLAEVALGKPSKRKTHDYYISKDSLKREGCDSCWGLGRTTPGGFTTMDDGTIVPNGKLTSSGVPDTSLLYDEFIVYDQHQLNLRYIVKIRANYKW